MQVGQEAPAFELKATNGRTFSSRDQVQAGPLVVAFYPLAFTGG
ncbi:redoxin domain-containing protein [Sulfobacillus sp. DSM 109850]|uniref:Redoxin domain-containing protein n=2 Tax=Sulfobacillus harzensis TaxID=2729629 RepID=A0A7Y0L4M1_9FIRM|nr:redoxin domain-containing protein [Sulfobacillus harzensis]